MSSIDKTVGSPRSLPELCEVLDCLARLDGKARVIVDLSGTVTARSANAFDTMEGDAEEMELQRRFDGGGKAATATVARLLAVRDEETELAVIKVGPEEQTMLVRSAAVDADHVYLVLSTPGQCGSPRITDLQKLFGLTASEAGIVKDLMEGCTPQAIAARRRNSIHTVHAHIHQCHQKIGVRNRE